VKNLHTTEKS